MPGLSGVLLDRDGSETYDAIPCIVDLRGLPIIFIIKLQCLGLP